MNSRRSVFVTVGFVLSVSLIAAAVAAWLVSDAYRRAAFHLVDGVCSEVARQGPEARDAVASALKAYTRGNPGGGALLPFLGYRVSDFSGPPDWQAALAAAAGFLAGAVLFLFTFLARNRLENRKIRDLTAYLEGANCGKARVLVPAGEDDFSKLADEIEKTVTALYRAKEQAVEAKDRFADNLSNIAHQIKTPITAISLAAQQMERGDSPAQVEKQLSRLTYLSEALLRLARLDAGALTLRPEKTDVFTLLTLAADNLQALFSSAGVSVEIPEQGETLIWADLDWTMEAVMNLMKNAIEHNPGGTVHCAYRQNPLYTEIQIRDDGPGFAKADLPHLFERFYRGQNAEKGGIGIGLALAKEIIERQNGTIRAQNGPSGGAFF